MNALPHMDTQHTHRQAHAQKNTDTHTHARAHTHTEGNNIDMYTYLFKVQVKCLIIQVLEMETVRTNINHHSESKLSTTIISAQYIIRIKIVFLVSRTNAKERPCHRQQIQITAYFFNKILVTYKKNN